MKYKQTILAFLKVQFFVLISLSLFSCKNTDTVPYEDPSAAGAASSDSGSSNVTNNTAVPIYHGSWRSSDPSGMEIDGSDLYVATSGGLNPFSVFNAITKDLILECILCKSTNGYNVEKYHDRIILSGTDIEGYTTLEVIDISNPALLYPVAYYVDKTSQNNKTNDMYFFGSYVVLSLDNGDYKILDISKLSQITEVASIGLGATGEGTAVSGNYLYLANGENGTDDVVIYDISDITYPLKVGSIDLGASHYADEVLIDGTTLYVSSQLEGFRVFDISSPTLLITPNPIGSIASAGVTHEVAIKGNYLYTAGDVNGVKVYDISASPTLVPNAGLASGAVYTNKIKIDGNTLYAYDSTMGLREVDITSPSSGTLAYSGISLENNARTITGQYISANISYVTTGLYGLSILDTTNKSAPVQIGSFTKGSDLAINVEVVGDYAFVTYSVHGLIVLDISDPTSPDQVGSYPIPNARTLKIQGDYAYIVYDNQIRIVDISNPLGPVWVSSISTGIGGFKIGLDGDILAVAEKSSGNPPAISFYNISNPISPILQSTITTTNVVTEIVIKNKIAYAADGIAGMKVIDIKNPMAPIVSNSIAGINTNGAVYIFEDTLYISTDTGLKLYSLATPLNPSFSGSFYSGNIDVSKVTVLNNKVHVANNLGGYKIFSF